MATNPSVDDLRRSLDEFVEYRNRHLNGDEKGEAQVFLDRLFKALGHDGVFEAGATLEMRVARRDNGGTAFADLVWKPRVLIEMKKAGQDLKRHYRQAFEYWIDLVPDRPRYVVLCNFDDFWIYDLNNQLDEPVDRVTLADLSHRWEALSFMLPVEQRPEFQNDLVEVTRESAATVARVFNHLIDRGVRREEAQRFILQCVMAMFAEDIGLLPSHFFGRAVEDCLEGASAYDLIFGLFREMDTKGETPGGRFAGTPYFNGGLFEHVRPMDLTTDELHALYTASREDWTAVRPEIFGTLFEQSLDQGERHAFGAHFTSEVDIQKIVLPTIVRPWRERIESAGTIGELNRLLDELLRFQVLDPACGCGNFLYVAYREVRRLERALVEKIQARRRGGRREQQQLTFVSPTQFHGIDINPFAVEIAKVTLMVGRKLAADELGDERTVLPLDDLDGNFYAADALQLPWPPFDVCIGNPPYLGRRRLIQERGAQYADWLSSAFPDVGGVSDYVVYWFRIAHDRLANGGRAGLVGTNSIREGDSRAASLDYILDKGGEIQEAVSSQPWMGEANVNVSIVNWTKGSLPGRKVLWLANGDLKVEVDAINSALSTNIDLRDAEQLEANKRPKRCFQGQTPGHVGGFLVDEAKAADLVARDGNGVVHPFFTGDELNASGQPERYIIDFPDQEAMRAEHRAPAAFAHVRNLVLPDRQQRADDEAKRNAEAVAANPAAHVNWHHRNFLAKWWQLSYRRSDLLDAIAPLSRYIGLSRYAIQDRLSIYAFIDVSIRPSDKIQVFAFDDDYSFGILQSSVHRAWFEARCTTLGQAVSYTSRTVFDTFPWPQDPGARDVDAVVRATEQVLRLRAKRAAEGISIGQQYDSLRDPGMSPLRDAHEELDRAVIAAYRFDPELDVLVQLLALNKAVAGDESAGLAVRGPGAGGFSNVSRTADRITA